MEANAVLIVACVSYRYLPYGPRGSSNSLLVLPTMKPGYAASYGFSVSLPDRYLWMTLDKSVW